MSDLNLGTLFQAQTVSTKRVVRSAPSTAFTSRLVIPVLPDSATELDRAAMAWFMMVTGTSATTDLASWKVYIAMYSVFMVPSLGGKLPPNLFLRAVMSQERMLALRGAYTRLMLTFEESEDLPGEGPNQAYMAVARTPGLPQADTSLSWGLGYAERHPKIYASHYSIVLFLLSKRVEGENHDAISQKRPEALRKKAHIDDVCAFLDGDLRPSDESHLGINNAWAESAALRAVCLEEFSYFSQTETDITQDLIYTSMHLMRFGGMQHAKITYSFLKAYPWAVEVPALKGPIGVYIDSIKASNKFPERVRPYIKLIYGDKVGLFPRNELDMLVACAVAVNKETNPTLQDFYVSDQFGAVVEAFMDERDRRALIRQKEINDKLGVRGRVVDLTAVTPESEEEDADVSETE